jgi:hypothetical protein
MPEKFRPGAIEKYDGSIDPKEFLHVYSTVLYDAGRMITLWQITCLPR